MCKTRGTNATDVDTQLAPHSGLGGLGSNKNEWRGMSVSIPDARHYLEG